MIFPFFTTIAIVLGILTVYMRQSTKHVGSDMKDLWTKELKANGVRKQPLTDIEYIEPDFDQLPFDGDTADETLLDYQNKLNSLRGQKIVNLSNITNTDLKLKYGVANLEYLSACDENYLTLVKYLYLWGRYLYEQGDLEKAKQVLEFGVSVHTDSKAHYRLLAEIYASDFDFEAIDRIADEAAHIASDSRDAIIAMLKSDEFL